MSTVLCIIHIPYDKGSKLNAEILRKKRDTENQNVDIYSNVSSENIFADGEKPTTKVDNEQDKEAKNEETIDSEKSDPDDVLSVKSNGEAEDTNVFFPAGLHKNSNNEKDTENKPKKPEITKKINRTLSYDLTEVFYGILQENKIMRASWEFTEDGEYWQVMFPFESKNCDALLNRLLGCGIGNNNFSSISILPMTVNFPAVLTQEDNEKSDSTHEKAFMESVKSRLTVAQVIGSIKDGSQLTFDYLMLICMASVIAAVGLVENSSVLLVASMLVSPLMGPILAGTFGFVIQDTKLCKTGVRNEVIGLLICIVMGFFLGILCGLVIPGADTITQEMSSRCEPRSLVLGFIVALPSGAGVALSVLGGNSGSLVGVAISASLLPPAVNGGIFFAFSIIAEIGSKDIFVISNSTTILPKTNLKDYESSALAYMGTISLILTLINIIVIFMMGIAILKVKEVAPHTGTALTKSFWKKDLKTTREYLKGHMMGNDNQFTETVLNEWGKIHDVDFNNKDTIKGEKGVHLAQKLKKQIEELDIDSEYNNIRQRVFGKPRANNIRRLTSLFPSSKPLDMKCEIADTTFLSRFMINKLDEKEKDNVKTFDISELPSNQTIKTKLPIKKESEVQPLLNDKTFHRDSLSSVV